MNKFIKIISVLLIISIICLSICGCTIKNKTIADIVTTTKASTTVNPGIDDIEIYLPYVYADSLNPFKSTTVMNQNLTTLLYDSLFNVDNSFKASALIADSFSVQSNEIAVKIKSGLKFSDGSSLNAEDVVYSYNKAKNSSRYSGLLTDFSGASSSGDYTVAFSLKYKNPDAVSSLTFPIIKDGSADSKIPVGSGRYTVKKNKILTANKTRLGGYHPIYNNIELSEVSDSKSIASKFKLGDICFYTEDFANGTYSQIIGSEEDLTLTNLVYLGFNTSKTVKITTTRISTDNSNDSTSEQTSTTKITEETTDEQQFNSQVRKAISMALDRNYILSSAFVGFGSVATTPFHPDYYKIDKCTLPSSAANIKGANTLLDKAGYKNTNSSGTRYNGSSVLNLSLAVCKSNKFKTEAAKIIKTSLADIGINVTIKQYSAKDFYNVLDKNAYDLYLGEAKLNYCFDLNSFFNTNGDLNYGIEKKSKSADVYSDFCSGKKSLQKFIDTFNDDVPFAPILYRKGVVVSSKAISVSARGCVSDCYYNIDQWKIS